MLISRVVASGVLFRGSRRIETTQDWMAQGHHIALAAMMPHRCGQGRQGCQQRDKHNP